MTENEGGFVIPNTYTYKERRDDLPAKIVYSFGRLIYRVGFWIVFRGQYLMHAAMDDKVVELDLGKIRKEWTSKFYDRD